MLTLLRTEATPFFIFDVARLRRNFTRFARAWTDQFPTIKVAYSYKTNALKQVTKSLLRLGAAADVVSGAELEMAIEDGYPPDAIFFNGPVKLKTELDRALSAGIKINIDSIQELVDVLELCGQARRAPLLGFRVSADRTDKGLSRFGLNDAEIAEGLRLLNIAGIDLSGMHFHVGSNINSVDPYIGCLRKYRSLAHHILDGSNDRPLWIDVGGGYPPQDVCMYDPPLRLVNYAVAVRQFFESAALNPGRFQLVLEPGRSLVEECAYFVMTIIAIKERDGRRVLVCDGGSNHVRHVFDWPHPAGVLEHGAAEDQRVEYAVYGTNCFEDDLLAKLLVARKDVTVGDHVILGSVGAYDISSAITWSRPLPAIIGVDGCEYFSIRGAQTYRDMRSGQW